MDSTPPEGHIVKSRTETVKTQEDGSVVTTTKTVYVTSVSKTSDSESVVGALKRLCTEESEDTSDLDFLAPTTRRPIINKEAYLKLHHIQNHRRSVEALKEKYQIIEADDKTDNKEEVVETVEHLRELPSIAPIKLSTDTIESLKTKYSPSSFGYPKIEEPPTSPKNPPPAVPQRSISLRSSEKPQLPKKPPSLIAPKRHSYIPFSQSKPVIPQRSSLLLAKAPRIHDKPEDAYDNLPFEVKQQVLPLPRLRDPTTLKFEEDFEERVIVRRSSSEDSIEKIESELSEFTMDSKQKDKKRSSSFRKIFGGGFLKDKKKTERKVDDKHKTKKTENVIVADNAQNEHMINRTSQIDHISKRNVAHMQQSGADDIEKRYAEMHINQFNKIKAGFANQDVHHIADQQHQYNRRIPDKFIESSSSSNTLESEKGTYQNALIAQAEMMYLRELELKALNKIENLSETPPRARETHQNVQLVKPKAFIPINSERPLPNPYHNGTNQDENVNNFNTNEKELKSPLYDFERNYSPNMTKSSTSSNLNSPSSPSFSTRSSPKSPTLEGSKLRLPVNREKVNLQPRIRSPIPQPRIKSPIPQPKISTDKIIATELLKKADRKDKQAPTHQNLEMEIDYPDNFSQRSGQRDYKIVTSSPVGQNSPIEAAKWHQKQKELAKSPSLLDIDAKQVTTNVTIHREPEIKRNSDLYSSLPTSVRSRNSDLRQRSVTPVRRIPSNASLQHSPSKQEMRQSVELYCWKEIQKLKEKQDQELKYQLQYTPYGYVEDPIIQRRSRSVEPHQQRSRRSTSLPREIKPSQAERSNRYNNPMVIPENRPVYYGENDIYGRNANFLRTSPQRRTVSSLSRGYEGYYANTGEVPYRPIFNRGTLNPNVQLEQYQMQKKNVSFNGTTQPNQVWPTKNGYVESPPQRRLDKTISVGSDEVFTNDRVRQNEIQRSTKEPIYGSKTEVNGRTRQEESPYGTRRQIEESYIIRRQIIEDPYGNRQIYQQTIKGSNPSLRNEPVYAVKENKQNLNEVSRQKQENLQNMYGTAVDGGVHRMPPINPIYSSKLSIQENPYGTRESVYGSRQLTQLDPYRNVQNLPAPEGIYGRNKQMTVSNKVCDMYGRIHDNGQRVPVSTSYGQVQQTGVIYGQLQGNEVTGRPPLHHSYNQLPNGFVRGSRLTSSANDMHRRLPHDPRYLPHGFNPNAPLPPTPIDSKPPLQMRRRGHPTISDTDSEMSYNRNYGDDQISYGRHVGFEHCQLDIPDIISVTMIPSNIYNEQAHFTNKN